MISADEETAGSDLTQGLRRLVAARLALDLSRRSPRSIAEIFASQATRHRCQTLPDYQRLLEREKEDGPVWARLIDELTISETYFFRDTGQMELLRQQLLPQLLRDSQGRPLRVWSAGCSSGEEPYSLAIMLDQLQGKNTAQVVGTDVNLAVLQTARAARYRERSLRSTPELVRQTYFTQNGAAWELLPKIRDRVNFWPENLARPSLQTRTGLDLIVCRNVLIYFEKEVIGAVLERFMRSLRPGGYLLTGHGELQGLEGLPLDVCCFENSLVYQRPLRALPQVMEVASRKAAVLTPPEPQDLTSLVEQCLRQGDYGRGRGACQRATREQPLDVQPRWLEARLARAQGCWSEARELLSQALYLDPDHGPSLLEMALIYAHNGELPKARRLQRSALGLLQPQDFPEVVADLEQRLGKCDS